MLLPRLRLTRPARRPARAAVRPHPACRRAPARACRYDLTVSEPPQVRALAAPPILADGAGAGGEGEGAPTLELVQPGMAYKLDVTEMMAIKVTILLKVRGLCDAA